MHVHQVYETNELQNTQLRYLFMVYLLLLHRTRLSLFVYVL